MTEGLVIEDLHTGTGGTRSILSGVSLSVNPGEFVALVGGSGCGKTMTAMSILQLLPPHVHVQSGSIRLGSQELATADEGVLNSVRGGGIGMLYQQPKRMFNPRKTIASHLKEPLKRHCGLQGKAADAKVLELLAEVGFDEPRLGAQAKAHQLSGGMAQRAMTALALAGAPDILLADEPTSSLDKMLEVQVLQLLDRERRERGLGILYITHNIRTVAQFADKVLVMEEGTIVESGPAQEVLNYPRSPYTKRLLEAASLAPEGNRGPRQGQPVPESRVPERGVQERREVLTLERVSKDFRTKRRASKRGNRPALSDISLRLGQGEILGVLGQSGSGKSTLARSIIGLENIDSGRISLNLQHAALQDVRRQDAGLQDAGRAVQHSPVQLVFQEPHDSFDPRMRLRTSLEAPLLRRKDLTKDERSARILQAIEEVGLDPGLLDRLPGQCSGGQLQRLTIARALLLEPSILICDEATSALDALTQRLVLNLLLRLHRDKGLSLVLISHDMDVIRYMSDRVAVLFKGRLVEVAETGEFFTRPQHEHSQALVSAALPVCELLSRTVRPQTTARLFPAEAT
ncbi:ABC transporter ATP-binding protein [Arthrobacter sp.]|uniref:ABC transporter ATP-binding protein n=1 Tax=Arthrobacter sp. TaxID=1667 RepID=UPI0028122EF3|nr:ABC transporter ATP-binding protein [Arthrobacter sp.]